MIRSKDDKNKSSVQSYVCILVVINIWYMPPSLRGKRFLVRPRPFVGLCILLFMLIIFKYYQFVRRFIFFIFSDSEFMLYQRTLLIRMNGYNLFLVENVFFY